MSQSKFKNNMGALYLRALFFETTLADKSTVVYTLKDEDHLGYPSLYRLYMEADDPTEYSFAIQHLDSWEHWQRLTKAPWFKEYLHRWRKELETRTRARALKAVRDIAASGSKEAFQANKFLLSGQWASDGQTKRRAGAPSKEEIKKAAHEIAETHQTVEEDFERLSDIKGYNA